MDTYSCSARSRATLLNVMAKRMQHCCSHLRTKERLDDVKDDVWWKSNFVQQLPSWHNMVAKWVQHVRFSNVGWCYTNMFSEPVNVWPGLNGTNRKSGREQKKAPTQCQYHQSPSSRIFFKDMLWWWCYNRICDVLPFAFTVNPLFVL